MRLYLETTIPNFLFADDAPDLQKVTELFFDWLRICPHELCTSPLVEQELDAAPEPKRGKMRRAMKSLLLNELLISAEADEMAEEYIKGGAIPRRFEYDALHVAIAVCYYADTVVTWNMNHMANAGRVERINRINAARGFPPIRILTPKEVMGL
jgi:hypothetical protein